VIQVGLISGNAVAVTLGVRRHLQSDFAHEPEETVCVSSRLILTLDAAQNLIEGVSAMLARANTESEIVVLETAKRRSARAH
jgi:hypothetical protein